MSDKARYVEAMRGQAEVARNQGDDGSADRIDDIADAVEEDDQISEGEAQAILTKINQGELADAEAMANNHGELPEDDN